VDNGNYDTVSILIGSARTTQVSGVEPSGFPIFVKPGQNTRLYFLVCSGTGGYDRSYGNNVTVYHTPYYLDVRGSS
jgi:hypothetical protein